MSTSASDPNGSVDASGGGDAGTDSVRHKRNYSEVMQDRSHTQAGNNARIQQIMAGTGDDLAPTNAVVHEHTLGQSAAPLLSTGNSARKLISEYEEKINSLAKESAPDHTVYFSTVHSKTKGDVLVERTKKMKAGDASVGSSESVATDKQTFIPSTFVNSTISQFEERLRAKFDKIDVDKEGPKAVSASIQSTTPTATRPSCNSAQEEENEALMKRQAIRAIMHDTSLTPRERSLRLSSVDNSISVRFERMVEDEANELKRQTIRSIMQDSSLTADERIEWLQGLAMTEDAMEQRDRNDTEEEEEYGLGRGLSSSLQEHSVNDSSHYFSQQSQLSSHAEERDDNYGLAIATAIAQDDEPEYIYNAIEYEPDSKPPLHRNRRFRVYTCFALFVALVIVTTMTVFVTVLSKEDEVTNEYITKDEGPTTMPTTSPTTGREDSGIIEQLEAGVLLRGETFDTMADEDPRILALDWILHGDGMQLVSDDVNLYQRYALAVIAYAFDSEAWFVCGKRDINATTSECEVYDYIKNVTETFGVWLSSTDECGWYGVTCSDDGIVRGVELINNDLIGSIPHELTGECLNCVTWYCSGALFVLTIA